MGKITKVGFKEFTRYVQSLKNGNDPCPFCGEMKWKLTTTMDYVLEGKQAVLAFSLPFGKIPTEVGESPGEIMINNAMPILIKQCMSCGNMNFFNHDTVLDKINSEALGERDE